MNNFETISHTWSTIYATIIENAVNYGPRVIGGLLILWLGMKAIAMIEKLLEKSLQKTTIDVSLGSFIVSIASIFVKIMLFISVAGMFGIETTSFIAILGAAWLAVGMALQGSLSNFASGVMILFFKPYKIGDLIEINGVLWNVKEITAFTTNLLSPENKFIVVPNSLATANNIVNYSKEWKIRVDVSVGVSYDADLKQTKKILLQVITEEKHVLTSPKPSVAVNELGDSSVNLIVRAYTKPTHYWDVFFGLTESCKIALDEHNINIPYPHQVVHLHDHSKEK